MSEQQATRSIQPVRDNPIVTMKTFLEARSGELAKVAVRGTDVPRVLRIALAAISVNNKLAVCTPASLYRSIHAAVQLGIEPGGPLGEGYLVPYGTECQLIVGWRGLARLAIQGGFATSINAHVVYEGDEFDVSLGMNETLRHVPAQRFKRERGAPVAVYAVAQVKDGPAIFRVLWMDDINRIKSMAKGVDRSDSPWKVWPDRMMEKSAVRQLCKFLPKDIARPEARQLVNAIAYEDANETRDTEDMGAQMIDIEPPAEEAQMKQIEASTPATARIAQEVRQKQAANAPRVETEPRMVAADDKPRTVKYSAGFADTMELIRTAANSTAFAKAQALYEAHKGKWTDVERMDAEAALAAKEKEMEA